MARSAFSFSTAVVGSPALAAETQIALVGPISPVVDLSPILLQFWFAFVIGSGGSGATVRIRQGNGITGALVMAPAGIHNIGAFNGQYMSGSFIDLTPGADQLYSLTLQITSGGGASTVNTVFFAALCL